MYDDPGIFLDVLISLQFTMLCLFILHALPYWSELTNLKGHITDLSVHEKQLWPQSGLDHRTVSVIDKLVKHVCLEVFCLLCLRFAVWICHEQLIIG